MLHCIGIIVSRSKYLCNESSITKECDLLIDVNIIHGKIETKKEITGNDSRVKAVSRKS